jgi:hypothetical protein
LAPDARTIAWRTIPPTYCPAPSLATYARCATPSRCCRSSARWRYAAVGRRHVAQHLHSGHRPRLYAQARQARLTPR